MYLLPTAATPAKAFKLEWDQKSNNTYSILLLCPNKWVIEATSALSNALCVVKSVLAECNGRKAET